MGVLEHQRLQILAPVIRKKKTHKTLIEKGSKRMVTRPCSVDGVVVCDVTEVPELEKNKQHNIDVVVDRIIIKDGIRSRLFDSIEAALRIAEGCIRYMDVQVALFKHYLVQYVDLRFPELEPPSTHHLAPVVECDGLGIKLEVVYGLGNCQMLAKLFARRALGTLSLLTIIQIAAFGVDMDTLGHLGG